MKHITSNGAARRRRPADGGYQRGEAARDRIVAAALKTFGEVGYDRATTRRIAAEAGLNTPALQYYFDGKDGLHAALGRLVVDRLAGVLEAPIAKARAALEQRTPEHCGAALWGLMDALFQLSLDPDRSPAWSRFLARTQIDGQGPAFAIVRDGLHAPLFTTVADLAAIALQTPKDGLDARLAALFLMNVLSSFSLSPAGLRVTLGAEAPSPERVEALRESLRRAVQRLVDTRPSGDTARVRSM